VPLLVGLAALGHQRTLVFLPDNVRLQTIARPDACSRQAIKAHSGPWEAPWGNLMQPVSNFIKLGKHHSFAAFALWMNAIRYVGNAIINDLKNIALPVSITPSVIFQKK
jgi:hypothetical protein